MVSTKPQPPQPSSPMVQEGLQRDVGLLGLLWASEGSVIGSGWLFGALTAATIAGPSALISWVIASIIIILLALVHAELGGLFPVTGGTTRFPHYAFGSFAGASFGWFSYIQAASVAPIEVLATIQYLSYYGFASGWYNGSAGTLKGEGYAVAVGFMVLFTLVNLLGVRTLARANNSITSWKVLVPIVAIVALLVAHFHSGNFTGGGGFFVHGSAGKDILLAVPAGGIVFSLLGFEQAVQLGGESANPGRDLPRAVIGSILIGAAIYILVQIAFIAALSPHLLTSAHGWVNLGTAGSNKASANLNKAPLATVASLGALAWLSYLLHVDAVVSPGGTGLIYLTSSSRISYGLSRNGYIPEAFERTSARKVPWFSVIIAAIIGLLFLLPFPSWGKLVNVVTSASVLMYAGAPLALGALRLSKPELPRVYRLPAANVLAPLAFITANFIVYWSGWGTYSTLMAAMIVGYLLMGISVVFKLNPRTPRIDWTAAVWFLPYLAGMGAISFFGSFGSSSGGPSGIIGGIGFLKNVGVGGKGEIPVGWDLLVLAVFSLIIYYGAMYLRLPPRRVDENVVEVYPLPVGE